MIIDSSTWWLPLEQKVVCPECKQEIHLAIKRGSMKVVYELHFLQNTSIHTQYFAMINVIPCKMSKQEAPEFNNFKKLKGYKKGEL